MWFIFQKFIKKGKKKANSIIGYTCLEAETTCVTIETYMKVGLLSPALQLQLKKQNLSAVDLSDRYH